MALKLLGRGLSPAAQLPADPFPIDARLNISRDYGGGWMGQAFTMDEPFVEPEDLIRESYENPFPTHHIVRVDAIWPDDEVWPMFGERYEFPIGAAMPNGTQEPLDDYRHIYDGVHA